MCFGEQHEKNGSLRGSKQSQISALETKLEELRKDLAYAHGGIFPHAILSAQQINMLSSEKPKTITELETLIGKVKTDKYGARIIDVIQQHEGEGQPNDTAEGAQCTETVRNKRPALEGSERGNMKKRRKKNALVLIKSSEDEK